MDVKGSVHSIETCGTVDGPGIRFVAFFQGCPLRCQYCHNPDTWDPTKGTEYTVDELMAEIRKYKSYMNFSGGGMTATGGEPLVQAKFVGELFKRCREEGIHTALDTSGFIPVDKAEQALAFTDLVLLDMKSFNPETYKIVTNVELAPTLVFLDYLKEKNIKVWIRFVLVPELTDNMDDIEKMAAYLSDFKNVEMVEVLPFHKMGEYKWAEMGLPYQLSHTATPHRRVISKVKDIFESHGLKVR